MAIGQLAKTVASTIYQSLSDKAKQVLCSAAELRDFWVAGVWAWNIRSRYLHYAKTHHKNNRLPRQYFKPLEGIAQRLTDDTTSITIDETLHNLLVGLHTTLQANEMHLQDMDK